MNARKKIGIVGAGMMGSEIALCFARVGYLVSIKDATLELAEKGLANVSRVLDKSLKKGKITEDEKVEIISCLMPTDNYGDLSDADLVIEAVFEDETLKKQIFSDLDTVCKADCIFATNTSSISVTILSTAVRKERIGQFLGMHFFSPASVMKLVEVIPGIDTQNETVDIVMNILRSIGKEPIRVKDVTGFAVNRIFHAMLIETCRLLEEEVASAEDIDKACKLGLGHPMGPFELMDILNNALNLEVEEILCNTYGERFRPRPNLKQRVAAKHLGRVTQRGWFDYSK
ncbi:MAG: 3-hydroxyacyl-CoA dehydrogenase family protein [Deltaproteobacteria bacterium]|nr:3-hydroxyacyl-CoA dehydrogenase family protein [Deltaproteobacteria bacterium]